jgi:hypothetical protein
MRNNNMTPKQVEHELNALGVPYKTLDDHIIDHIRSAIHWVAYKTERLNTWLERLEGRIFEWTEE